MNGESEFGTSKLNNIQAPYRILAEEIIIPTVTLKNYWEGIVKWENWVPLGYIKVSKRGYS